MTPVGPPSRRARWLGPLVAGALIAGEGIAGGSPLPRAGGPAAAAETVTLHGATALALRGTATLTLDLAAQTLALTATLPPLELPPTPATHWVRQGEAPGRLLVTLHQPGLTLQGEVRLGPDLSGVLTVVASGSKETYLLGPGPAPTPGGIFFVDGRPYEDVTPRVDVKFSLIFFHLRDQTFRFTAQLRNLSERPLPAPLALVFEQLAPADLTLASPAGQTETGKPVVLIESRTGATLLPRHGAKGRVVVVGNPRKVRFRFVVRVGSPSQDASPPVITISNPPEGMLTNQTRLTVQGTVDDPTATVDVNGVAATLEARAEPAPTIVWTAAAVPLPAEGANLITATARDPGGNVGQAAITVVRDTVAPSLAILTPGPGTVTNLSPSLVTVSTDDPAATVTINGLAAGPTAPGAGTFTARVPLIEGLNTLEAVATDRAGNVGRTTTTLRYDRTPPTVSLSAPSEARAGERVTVTLAASDPPQADSSVQVRLLLDGILVAGPAPPPLSLTVTVPPASTVGTLHTLTGSATDEAGNQATQSQSVTITGAITGAGFLQGQVLDDATGLRLAGVTVAAVRRPPSAGEPAPVTTGADGAYIFELAPGPVVVTLTKPGYTPVARPAAVLAELRARLLDARLSPLDRRGTTLDAAGGTASNSAGSVRLIVPPAALSTPHVARLTLLSPQGLQGRVPLGWSPVLAVHIDPVGVVVESRPEAAPTTAQSAVLRFTLPEPLRVIAPATAQVRAARYDPTQHAWVYHGLGQVSADGTALDLAIAETGQYALVLPDAEPSPLAGGPLPAGAPLPGVPPRAIPEAATATIDLAPAVLPATAPKPATGQVVLTSPTALPSGSELMAEVRETFTKRSGEVVTPEGFSQDLLLFQNPPASGPPPSTEHLAPSTRLSASFPVSPSVRFTLQELRVGDVRVELFTPEAAPAGSLVGPQGAVVRTLGGTTLTIPAGALARDTVASLTPVPLGAVTLPLPAGFTLLTAYQVELLNAVLARPADLSIPLSALPSSASCSSCPLLLARVIQVAGLQRLQLVARAQVSADRVVSTPGPVPLPGIVYPGTYVLLQGSAPVAFGTGVVKDPAGQVVPRAVITGSLGFYDLARPDGTFTLGLPVGDSTVTFTDPATNSAFEFPVTVTDPTQPITRDVVLQVLVPVVVGIVPAPDATAVILETTVQVTFSQPIDRTSLSATTLQLLDGSTQPVPGSFALSPLGTTVTFYPAAKLLPNTTYTVAVTTSIRDIRGRAVPSPQTSRFTTVKAGPTLAAGQITISFPDRTTGRVRVTATQGTAEPDNLVLLLNTSSGSTTSTTVNADGSFTGELFALLGDELLAVIQNDEGNQTVLPIGTYRDVDGTAVVTRLGGEVTGGGDAKLTLPPGSVIGPTPVKVTLKAPGDLPVQLPASFQSLGGLEIEAQGTVLKGDVKASIPLPAGFTPPTGAAAQGFLAQLVTIAGQPETVIVDAARVVGGRLVNASPPFPGLQHLVVLHSTPAGATFQPFGANTFWYFINPLPYPALVTGTVTRTDGRPVPGAIVRAGGGSPLALSGSEGKYALHVYPTALTPQSFIVTATDPASGLSQSATIFVQAWTPDQGGGLFTQHFTLGPAPLERDTTPPTITLTPQALSLHQAGPGRVNTGDAVSVVVSIADDRGVRPETVTLAVNGQGLALTWLDPGPEARPRLANFSATFRASEPDRAYVLTALGADTSGNAATAEAVLQSVTGALPANLPGRAPTLLVGQGVPRDGARGVNVLVEIRLPFSEAIFAPGGAPVGPETIRLEELGPAGRPVEVDYFLEDRGATVLLRPRQALKFATPYQVSIQGTLEDQDGQPLGRPLTTRFTTTAPATAAVAIRNAKDVALLGEVAFVLDRERGLAVVNVADPLRPVPLYLPPDRPRFPIGALQALAVAENLQVLDRAGTRRGAVGLVVGWQVDGQNGVEGFLELYAFSPTPAPGAAPELLRRLILSDHTAGTPMRVLVLGERYALVGSILQGLLLVDLLAALAGQPPVVGTLDPEALGLGRAAPNPTGLVKYRDGALYSDLNFGLWAIDASRLPALAATRLSPRGIFRLQAVADFPVPDPAGGPPRRTDLALLTEPGGGALTVFDLGLRTPLGVAAVPGALYDLGIQGARGLAFVNGGPAGVHVLDFTRPEAPQAIGTVGVAGHATGTVQVQNELIYSAGGTGGFQVIDTSRQLQIEALDAQGYGPLAGDPLLVPQPPRLVRQPSEEPREFQRRLGAVSDGASLLVLRLRAPPESRASQVTLTITDALRIGTSPKALGALFDGAAGWPPVPAPDDGREGALTLTLPLRPAGDGWKLGFAVYRPPRDFVAAPRYAKEAARPVVITAITDDPDLEEANRAFYQGGPATVTLTLERPPVLLVHGVWSSARTWDRLLEKPPLPADEPDDPPLLAVDYSTENTSGFATFAPIIRDHIRAALAARRTRRIAATQVDLVAHSMGGLGTRTHMEGGDSRHAGSFSLGDLRRVITIGTPYYGSPWALPLCAFLRAPTPQGMGVLAVLTLVMGGRGNLGAYCDLAPGSPALRRLEDAPAPGALHAVAGIAAPASPEEALAPDDPLAPLAEVLRQLGATLITESGDLIVSVQSQLGGLTPPRTTVITGITHTGETRSPVFRERLRDLLNRPDSERQIPLGPLPPIRPQ